MRKVGIQYHRNKESLNGNGSTLDCNEMNLIVMYILVLRVVVLRFHHLWCPLGDVLMKEASLGLNWSFLSRLSCLSTTRKRKSFHLLKKIWWNDYMYKFTGWSNEFTLSFNTNFFWWDVNHYTHFVIFPLDHSILC